MATYKLIQDIEAEDKILGPLTLRQFIFALVAVFLFYICFILVTKNAAFLLVLFLPPALFCAFFAFPFGRDQPTETWALAKLRFWFKPRQRIWNQSGVKELVTITVPKKVERVLTNGLSQTEVTSRLRALADTIDSRGWATKNASSGVYSPVVADMNSDRLIDISSMPQDVPADDMPAADDMLDETNNPIAQQFDTMIDRSSRNRRQQLLDQLNDVRQDEAAKAKQPAAASDSWFMNNGQAAAAPAMAMPAGTGAAAMARPPEPMVTSATIPAPVAGETTPDEAALAARLSAQASSRQVSFGNLRTLQPLGSQPAAPPADIPMPAPSDGTNPQTAAAASNDTVTATSDPAILSLAKNDDFDVATLAREARKNRGDENQPRNEVMISLH
ncbi:MAG TPA: PrgI family protein [Candidatus Dormibacteraeota bacterium]|nr:PrgI family protein [Candidatus Dormibacteraeota bacterium]